MRGKKISFVVGLWMSVLSAGTWILPVNAMAPVVLRGFYAPAVPLLPEDSVSGQTSLSKFERGSVARAWRSAWGSASAPGRQAVALDGRGDGIHVAQLVEQSDPLLAGGSGEYAVAGIGMWRELVSAEMVDRTIEGSDGTTPNSIHLAGRIAAGELIGSTGEAVFLTVFLLDCSTETADGMEYQATVLVPMAAVGTAALAREPVDAVLAAQSATNGGMGLECMNNDWLGDDGTQCCMLYAAYSDRLSACLSDYAGGFFDCLLLAGGAGGTVALGCVGLVCRVPTPPCVATCMMVGIGVGAVSFWLCLESKFAAYQACRLRARADYIESLASHGCAPVPEGFEP